MSLLSANFAHKDVNVPPQKTTQTNSKLTAEISNAETRELYYIEARESNNIGYI